MTFWDFCQQNHHAVNFAIGALAMGIAIRLIRGSR